jgi:protein TIF31
LKELGESHLSSLSHSFFVLLCTGGCIAYNVLLSMGHIVILRVLNKVLSDFGEASVLGVKAISEGHIAPMNPNEPTRSQVYLHNNIFFSRAIDGGLETFKIARGDKAARKSASRDVHCLGVLHRIEQSGIYTLATVVIDYLGTRFVCQSILPGILSGEKTHKLLYGSVEAGTPLMWDKEMHELLDKTLSKRLMVASRPLPRDPLTDERAAEVEIAKKNSPIYLEKKEEEKKEDDSEPLSKTILACAPIEAKGIQGSDQRHYVLDMTRLTPRDANWISQEKGGTGKWEGILASENKPSSIPSSLEDDEWTLSVLRSELVTKYIQLCMNKYMSEKKEKQTDDKGADDKVQGEKEKEKNDDAVKKKLSDEDLKYLASLRFNVNVFLPDIKSLEGLDDDALEQVKNDEEMTRKAATYLWDEIIPSVTMGIRNGAFGVPPDGRALTEFIHLHGINCRYLGRLAYLAQIEEEKDKEQNAALKESKTIQLYRRTIPKAWLELLECEMVARAAKHVLDSYLTENGGACAMMPGQTVASFLSALISEREETAGETETRMSKAGSSEPDEEDFDGLTISNIGGAGEALPASIRGRAEVWEDVENEVARRFRYCLTLYNKGGKSGRTLYIPLLRRLCQRTGVRIAAKNYEVGGKCLCSNSSGGQVMASYPISTLDIVDFVPLIKHAAAHSEGFVPCHIGPGAPFPPLHISLPDARSALEQAHVARSRRQLQASLELAQEAASLYQRVTESQSHPGVVGALDLMATILFEAGEAGMAANHALKALGLLVQTAGFDSHDAVQSHLLLFNMLSAAGDMTRAVKHLKAGMYLAEVLGGPDSPELANCYHKLGSIYQEFYDLKTAKKFNIEAEQRDSCDRFAKGMILKGKAYSLAALGEYKEAFETEKIVFRQFMTVLGPSNPLTKESEDLLKKYNEMAKTSGNKQIASKQQQIEAEKADAIANEIAAAEAAEEAKQKKKKNKKKGKK